MLEIFSYGFMVRAFIAGICIGCIAPLIGTFLVTKRFSLMADSLAHIALSGVALGLFLGIYPTFSAIVTTVIAAICIENLRTKTKISGELALSLFLSGGLALAVVLMSLSKGYGVDVLSYLFGSITTVSFADLVTIVSLSALVIAVVAFFYKELVYISFDEEAALVGGVPTQLLNTLLIILTALVVCIAMSVVGALLIGALMVIPVVSAMQLKKTFKQTVLLSIVYSVCAVIVGLFVSYYGNIAPGGSIVLTSIALFLLTLLFKR